MQLNNTRACSKCSSIFTHHNMPHRLIQCSHLMCKICLLSEKSCPQCGIQINIDDHFIKDFSIVSLEQIKLPSQNKSIKKQSAIKMLEKKQKVRQPSFSHFQDICVDEFMVEECLLHGKPADLICIDDKSIICASCALFGKHKGHQVINREGLLTKFATYVEQCLGIYDQLKQEGQDFSILHYKDDYQKLLSKKRANDHRKVNQKFQALISMIRVIQKKQILKINEYYKQKQQIYEEKQERIQNIELEMKSWFSKIQNIGGLMSDTRTLQKLCECVPFIDERNKSRNQILDKGEELILKLKQTKNNIKKQLKVEDQLDCLMFDEQKIKGIQSYFSLKKQEIQRKKRVESVRMPNQYSLSKSPISIKQQTGGRLMSSSKRLKTQTPTLLSRATPQIKKQIEVNLFSDDNLLLSVQHHDQTVKYNQARIPKIQRVQIAEQMDVQNIPFLSISDIRPAASFSSGQSSDQSRFIPRDFELREIVNEGPFSQTSQINVDQKKKKKVEFPQKFKGIVDDLRNDRAETIDLTGAQVGDASILSLCPFIKRSKKLKTLKLIKNKLTDDCLAQLFQALSESKVVNLNLSQNLLTDKACSILAISPISLNLKSITLTLNKINRRSVKNKTDELTKKNIAILL